jgi:hypothetical protein
MMPFLRHSVAQSCLVITLPGSPAARNQASMRVQSFSMKMERAMGIKNRDREQYRLGGEEILYRSTGGVCAAMALRSP